MRYNYLPRLQLADNTVLNAGSGGDTYSSDEVTTLNGSASSGVKVQRIKNGFGPDGTYTDVDTSNCLPVVQHGAGFTYINYSAVGAASGTTGTETLITLTRAAGTGATTSASSFVITSGKRFRITSITFGSRGSATATAQVSNFTIRINTGGAIATSSAARITAGTATPATALAWDRFSVSLPAEGYDVGLGDGTLQWGVTANAVFVTNAPTWYVNITGFEY